MLSYVTDATEFGYFLCPCVVPLLHMPSDLRWKVKFKWVLGKNASGFIYKSLKNLSWVLSYLLRVMLREIYYIATEYCLATDENRGVKQHLLFLLLTLIKWWNKCTLLMAMKSTGNFIFPSDLMKCSRLTLLVLMFHFLTPAGSTSIHRIVSQNWAKGFWLCTMITMQCSTSVFSIIH